MGLFLLVLFLILLIAALPSWPYSRGWSYYPSVIFGIIFIILLFLWFAHVGPYSIDVTAPATESTTVITPPAQTTPTPTTTTESASTTTSSSTAVSPTPSSTTSATTNATPTTTPSSTTAQ